MVPAGRMVPHVGAALALRVGNAPHVVVGVVTLRALPAARDELQAGASAGRTLMSTSGSATARCCSTAFPVTGASLAARVRCATPATGTASNIGCTCRGMSGITGH